MTPPLPHFSREGVPACQCGERVPIVNVTWPDGTAVTAKFCHECDKLQYRGR